MRVKLASLIGFVILMAAMFGTTAKAFAEDPLSLNDSLGEYNVIPHMQVVEEPEEGVSVHEMLKPETWQNVPQLTEVPNFGYDANPHWARIQIQNNSSREEWLMQIDYSALDWIEVYVAQDGQPVLLKQGGDYFPFGEREVMNRSTTFRLNIEPGSTKTILLRVKMEGALTFPIKLRDSAQFAEHEQTSYLLLGGYYGIMLIMIVYNSILAVTLKSKTYVYYLLINASAVFLYSTLNGIAYQYLWPDAVWWNNRAIVFFMCLSHMAALLFTRNFLNLKRYVPRMHVLFTVFITLEIVNIGVLLFSYSAGLKMMSYTLILLEIAIIAAGGMSWYRGSKSASFFTIGWGVFMVGAIISSLTDAGYFPQWRWATFASQIGSVFEAVILSLGLAENIQTMFREKELAVSVMKETRRLAETDDLTGLYNRRYMVSAFQSAGVSPESEFAVTSKSKTSAMLIIDVDYFKKINDTYGHDVGDKVLIEIANILKGHCRPQDTAGRFGGEEFIILMKGADLERGVRKANAILEAIGRHPMRVEGAVLHCTISIGVAEWRTDREEDTFTRVLQRADEALYEAKRGGRNRICTAGVQVIHQEQGQA